MKSLLALLLLLSPFCLACAAPDDSDSTITIGTFNIEWLGDGESDMKPRTEEDYKNIATLIQQTNADVLGIEEVENLTAINKVLQYLPQYHVLLGTHGRAQNVGVLYRDPVSVSSSFEYLPLATRGERNRPGFVCTINKNGFKSTMMVVHLKSTSRADSTKELRQESFINRREQIHVMHMWLDSMIDKEHEANVLIVGDFNDFPKREQNATLSEILSDSNAVFLTREEHSCKEAKWYTIDHIVCSPEVYKRWLDRSLHSINAASAFNQQQVAGISDHCPVVTSFRCKP